MADFESKVLKKLESFEKRFDSIDKRFDSVDKSLDRLQAGQEAIHQAVEQNREYINQAFRNFTEFYDLKTRVEKLEAIAVKKGKKL